MFRSHDGTGSSRSRELLPGASSDERTRVNFHPTCCSAVGKAVRRVATRLRCLQGLPRHIMEQDRYLCLRVHAESRIGKVTEDSIFSLADCLLTRVFQSSPSRMGGTE